MSNKKHTVDELSALFDGIDVGNNLDTEVPADYGIEKCKTKNLRPFDARCEDIQKIMKSDIVEDKSEPVEKFSVIATESASVLQTESSENLMSKQEDVVEGEQKSTADDPDNPLGLVGDDLQAYNEIRRKYPQFTLFDGTVAFKDFYRWKVRVLKSILTNFPILPLADMREIAENTNVNHQVGNDVVDPELIRERLDKAYACRTHLTTLLAKAHAQYSLWKRSSELLSSKLWKDHESKGVHKRDALTLEHNFDMIDYYDSLKGFIDSATIIDNLLKAASDSLSRQLSCITIREQAGVAHRAVSKEIANVIASENTDNELDNLDTINPGIVIKEPTSGGAFCVKEFGGKDSSESDFFSEIG